MNIAYKEFDDISLSDVKLHFGFLLFLEGLALINLLYFPETPVVIALLGGFVILGTVFVNSKFALYFFFFSIWLSLAFHIEVGNIVIRVVDIALVLLLVSWLVRSALKKETFNIVFHTPMNLSLFFLFSLGILSLFSTTDFTNTLVEDIQIIELIICFFVVITLISDIKDAKIFLYTALLYALIDAFWILFNIWTGNIGGRKIGLFDSPADELSYAVFFAFVLSFYSRHKFAKVFLAVVVLLLTLAMILTLGRGIIIITTIMIFLFGFLYCIRHKRIGILFISGTITLFISIIIVYLLPGLVASRYESIIEGGDGRNFRLFLWYAALQAIQKYPILGVGIGNSDQAIKTYMPDWAPSLVKLTAGGTPHNEFLHFAIQAGVIGVLVALVFYITLWYQSVKLYRIARGANEYIGATFLCTVSGMLVWMLANDMMLAGKGILVILLSAFIIKLRLIIETNAMAGET